MKPIDHSKIVGIIPARYDSTRLPGKPLKDIGGKPMIQWVYERASKASLVERCMVATDDQRIMKAVQQFGGDVMMTPGDISTGTDRVAFAAKELDADIVVNIQGDEPFIASVDIDRVAEVLIDHKNSVMGTLVKRIKQAEELSNPNTVKVVVNTNMEALYFSRSPIPFCRDETTFSDWMKSHHYFKHMGIYSFRKDFLHQYASWQPTSLEKIEKLEQLRTLQNGYPIHVAETDNETVRIDTPEDLEQARNIWKEYLSVNGKGD